MIRTELKKLAEHSAIYGFADVLPYFVNFLLLPVFTTHLLREDYGALGILLLFGVLTKIFFRMGLDSGFFRIYYEQKGDRDRRVLATTLFLTATGVSIVLFTACAVFAVPLGRLMLGSEVASDRVTTWILLVAADTLLNTFAFVPMNLFRMEGRPKTFTRMTLFRSFINIGLKLWLVVNGYGVTGVLAADVVASLLFVLALLPTLIRNLAASFSGPMLAQAAAFGLPKVPHGLAQQVLNLSDRKLIEIFATLAESGLYHIGYVMGTGVKFFLSAFELAWAPFVYGQLAKPDAPRILARVATYAFAALFGIGLLNAIFGRELLFLMAKPRFHAAHPVIPIVVLAYVMQGVFALTSIGIGISKKSGYFPMMTFSAAALNVLLNLFLIPRYGILGAAWSTVAGYALMAALGAYLGQRHYPIPFEWGRLSKIVAAASLSFAASTLAPLDPWSAIPVKLLAALGFPLALYLLGFFRPDEILWLKSRLVGSVEPERKPG
ncbi:MAG: polysaccharide biosynthesis C-terminal domain-containing protein [Vicinamibacteria bacterium]